jgi:UDP-N-acetylmuramyl pentapeptide phosphotransferase/UDP-N-acetylglucosamine-1-phosphate transferase
MIGNPKWFSQRKYSGWGLTPNCWQGWLYIGVAILPFIILSKLNLPGILSPKLMTVFGLIFAIDFIDIFRKIKKDERDLAHEAIAERNAMWVMITALCVGIAFQAGQSIVTQKPNIDPVILVALIGATITKAITYFYLRNK